MLFKGNSSRLELLIGKIQAHKEPSQDEQHKSKEALGTGSSSWHSEDGGPNSRRGGETPSSCATPTSASFPSEPEVDADVGLNPDGNNPTAPYPCQFCERTFPRLSYLKKHEQSHGDQMPYRCSWCARLFKHKRSRDRHLKLHTGDRRYRCTHCDAAFSRSDHLKIHMKTHDTQKPYQCTACSRGYNTAAALTSHMQSHKKHQSSSSQSTGKLQDIDYGRRSVSSHSTSSPPVPSSPSPSLNLSLNPKSGPKTSQGTGSASTTPVLSSPLKLTCMYCTRVFSCMQQLQMHVHAMHQTILSGAEGLARTASPGRVSGEQRALPRDKPLDRSNQESAAKELRQERAASERDHYNENAFTCNQCTMKFSTLACLREHLLSIHRHDGFATMMMCPLCGIACASTASYAEHYVLQHCENRRPAPATGVEYGETKLNGVYDGGAATRDGRLSRGRDTTAEAADLTNKRSSSRSGADATSGGYTAGTLLCAQCGAALKDFDSFREHVARHLQADHMRSNQETSVPRQQHSCPKCDAVFADREDMLAHLTKHYLGQVSKEYVCNACKKFYSHPDLLQRHLLDVHAHHLYRCALCRDTFDSRVAIQVHFAVKHSQECQVYRCSTCSTVSNNENSPSGGNATAGDHGRSFFRSEAEMMAHVRSVHAPPMVASLTNSSPVGAARSPASTPGVGGVARCVFCGVCCGSELELQLHLASHSTSLYRCPLCREAFAVEFLLDRHIAQTHQTPTVRSNSRENGRVHRPARSQEETKSLKRGRSPASSNNNSLNQRDNNNKRAAYGTASGQQQQCELCERGEFANEAELQAHKKLAHAPTKLPGKGLSALSMTCAYCGEVCRSRGELDSHTRIQHASNEPGGRHKCNICDEVCPSGASLAEHKLQKHCKIQLSDTCVVCRGCLTTESQFLDHVQRHSLENVDPQQRMDNSLPHLPAPCVVCRQTLISDLECRLHARHHLRTSTGSSSRSAVSSPASPNNTAKTQSQSCCLCLRDLAAEDFVSLPPNPASTSGQPVRVCKSCYMRHSQGLPILNSVNYEQRAKYDVTWLASKDGQWDGTKDKWEYERSLKVENRSRNEGNADKKRCEECGVKFEDPEEAEKHRIAEHEKTGNGSSNTYTCIQCQVSFPTEAEIQQHVRTEHLEAIGKASLNALQCHLCVFKAPSPLQLQSHLIEHTFAGCNALSCYICRAFFTTSSNLQDHMVQQHGLGARPYDCPRCTLKFFFRTELDHHMLISHRSDDSTSPAEQPTTKNREAEEANHDGGVTVKKEVMQEGEEEDQEEEEEVNVDDQVGQEEEDGKAGAEKQKLKIEVDSETASCKES